MKDNERIMWMGPRDFVDHIDFIQNGTLLKEGPSEVSVSTIYLGVSRMGCLESVYG